MSSAFLNIVDNSLNSWVSKGLNCHPGSIPTEMATGQTDDDWHFWKPVCSAVTDTEINELQNQLGVVFPVSYVKFLKHRHFIHLHIGELSFFSHPYGSWQQSILKAVLRGYPRELLLDRGYLPFADFSDWGLWCFNLRESTSVGEYSVYQWDHELQDSFTYVGNDLASAVNSHLAAYGT